MQEIKWLDASFSLDLNSILRTEQLFPPLQEIIKKYINHFNRYVVPELE